MGAIDALGNQREDYCQLGTKRENKLPPLVVMRAAVAITGLLGATPPPTPHVPPTQPRSSPPPLKPEVTMISGSLDNPTLPSPGLEIVGISVR